MNYQRLEELFRQDQLELNRNLQLNLAPADIRRLHRDWKAVRSTNIIHVVGGLAGMVYAIIGAVMAYANWETPLIGIPLALGTLALLVNGVLFPVQKVPTTNLERFSAIELANKLKEFQRYALRRFPFDVAAVVISMLSFLNWSLRFRYGIDPFLPMNDGLAWRVWPMVAAFIIVPMLIAWRMNEKSVRELKELEDRLRGYEAEEYV